MRRAALILIVSLGIAVPSEARISPVRGHFGPVMEKASEQETLVARSKRKKKKAAKSTAPSAPSVAAEPVKITTPSVSAGVVQKGRKSQAAYVLDQNSPLDMKLAGAGKLALVFYQVLPAGKVPKGTVEVVVDRGRATKVNLSDRPNRKFSLTGGPKGQVCPPKNHVEQLKAGEHLVSIQTTGGVVAMVRIEFYAGGSKTPAPIELVPPGSGLMAAMSVEDDELTPEPPSEPAPPPIPNVLPKPEPKALVASAPETAAMLPRDILAQRLKAGEARDGIVGEYAQVSITNTREDEAGTQSFYRVGAEESFSFMVQGPGEVKVRLHRLVDAAAPDGGPYKIIILEDDVLLQQLEGETTKAEHYVLETTGLIKQTVAEPKEYHLKVGPKLSRLAFQIAGAAEGMVVRYDFEAEEMSLAAIALDFDDDEGGGGEDFSMGASAMATVVMEVAVGERIIIEQRESFLGLGAQAGVFLPASGGDMGMAAGVELSFALPMLDNMFALGVHGSFHRHQLATSVGDLDGAAIDASSTVMAVPVVGKITARFRLAEVFGLFVHGGFGICYVTAERTALGAVSSNSVLAWAAQGGAGAEVKLGPGWLSVESAYLYAPVSDFGDTLNNYTPKAPIFGAGYRLGI